MTPVKGGQNRYAALPARDVSLVQVSHLQQRFELAPRLYLAEEVVRRANEGLEHYEAEAGTRRLQPGELLIEHEGQKLPIPLLSPDWSRRLADGFSLSAVRRHLEYEQLQTLLQCDDSLTLEQLWRWTDQKELVRKRGGREFLPSEPLNVEALHASPRPMEDITLPDVVLEPITEYLARDYGCKPALARAMAEQAARIRQWCCPRIQEVRPGQAVWLVYSTRRGKRGQPRLLVPVVLTLITAEEQSQLIDYLLMI